MSNRSERNQPIIAEFRANAGKVGGPFADTPLLLLHTTGATSGQPRINPPMAGAISIPPGITTFWRIRW